eukprot:jgi/Tetstr1/436995/TSEL_002734.t1
MADHAAIAAAAASGQDAMEIDTRVIQVEMAKAKTPVPSTDVINASRILGDRREVRQLIARVATVFADINDFQSKLVACFHSNSNLPGVIMRYALACVSPQTIPTCRATPSSSPITCGARSTSSRHTSGTTNSPSSASSKHASPTRLMSPSRLAGHRANKPIDSCSTICRHLLEAIDLEFTAATSGKRKHAADPPRRQVYPSSLGLPRMSTITGFAASPSSAPSSA